MGPNNRLWGIWSNAADKSTYKRKMSCFLRWLIWWTLLSVYSPIHCTTVGTSYHQNELPSKRATIKTFQINRWQVSWLQLYLGSRYHRYQRIVHWKIRLFIFNQPGDKYITTEGSIVPINEGGVTKRLNDAGVESRFGSTNRVSGRSGNDSVSLLKTQFLWVTRVAI